jgi:riboflavin biosynthesis pyrimidine reductase
MRRLLPDPGETTVAEQMAGFDPASLAPPERPYVFTNFAITVDGKATLGGVSGPIGTDADTAMLVGLRTVADAVMIGAGTMRAERYGRPVSNPEKRELRRARGLDPDPLMVIVATDLGRIPWDAPLFTEGEGRVLILVPAPATAPETATEVRVEAVGGGERADVGEAVARLRAEHGVRSLLCEGGPSLHAELLRAGALDEIFLTRAPAIGGGTGPGLFSGLEERRRELRLAWLLEHEGELFARYQVTHGAEPA